MQVQEKLQVFAKVAAALNRQGVTWAVGGSLMLYFRGVVTDFNDIDLMAAAADGERAAEALVDLGAVRKPVQPSPRFESDGFWKLELNGLGIDIMAGLGIIYEGQKYTFPLRKGDISDTIELLDEKIPLQGVREWRELYRLMQREEKVRLLDAWLARRDG